MECALDEWIYFKRPGMSPPTPPTGFCSVVTSTSTYTTCEVHQGQKHTYLARRYALPQRRIEILRTKTGAGQVRVPKGHGREQAACGHLTECQPGGVFPREEKPSPAHQQAFKPEVHCCSCKLWRETGTESMDVAAGPGENRWRP